jgi:hypothetical protein
MTRYALAHATSIAYPSLVSPRLHPAATADPHAAQADFAQWVQLFNRFDEFFDAHVKPRGDLCFRYPGAANLAGGSGQAQPTTADPPFPVDACVQVGQMFHWAFRCRSSHCSCLGETCSANESVWKVSACADLARQACRAEQARFPGLACWLQVAGWHSAATLCWPSIEVEAGVTRRSAALGGCGPTARGATVRANAHVPPADPAGH